MTRRDTPQSERRAALDAAIAALDEQRRKHNDWLNREPSYLEKISFAGGVIYEHDPITPRIKEKVDELNRYIRILSDMREEGPLL